VTFLTPAAAAAAHEIGFEHSHQVGLADPEPLLSPLHTGALLALLVGGMLAWSMLKRWYRRPSTA
jgi:hypothetical protein